MIRISLVSALVAVMLLSQSLAAYADDGDKGDSDVVIDIGISGDLQVDITASGPSELNVEAKGPSQVNIDAGEEVDLNVEAGDESEVFIDGQEFDPRAAYDESRDDEPSGDLDNESLNLQDGMWKLNPYVATISVAFPALGLLTLLIIGLL